MLKILASLLIFANDKKTSALKRSLIKKINFHRDYQEGMQIFCKNLTKLLANSEKSEYIPSAIVAISERFNDYRC